jgi:SAM-dependent methyltransferase
MKQAQRYNRFLLDLIRDNATGTRVLDHGAGAGTFAKPTNDSGLNVLCMEPDEQLREALVASGLEAVASLDDITEGSVDYAYTLNVLEHIRDDQAAITSLYHCLKPGGRLLVYVPAFQVLYSQMDEHVGHFRRYRRNTLISQLCDAGFEVGDARYVDSLGFFASLVYKLIGDRSGSVSPGSVGFYDSIIFPISRLIDVLSFGSFGKNLLVVATKPQIPRHD